MVNENGYLCLYKGKKFEVYAESTHEAQKKCAKEHGIKKAYEITVMLCEMNGEQVVHAPMF